MSGKVQGSREVLQSREDRYTDPADKVQVCSWENLFFKHPSLTGALGTFPVVSRKIAYGQSILQAYQRGGWALCKCFRINHERVPMYAYSESFPLNFFTLYRSKMRICVMGSFGVFFEHSDLLGTIHAINHIHCTHRKLNVQQWIVSRQHTSRKLLKQSPNFHTDFKPEIPEQIENCDSRCDEFRFISQIML